jgi:hypothetical protein
MHRCLLPRINLSVDYRLERQKPVGCLSTRIHKSDYRLELEDVPERRSAMSWNSSSTLSRSSALLIFL